MSKLYLGPKISKEYLSGPKRPMAGQKHLRVAQEADAAARKRAGRAKEPSLPKLKFLERSN